MDITEKIKEKINNNEIKMKPRIYFVFGSMILSIGIFLSFLVSAFFVNVLKHRIRMSRLPDYLQMQDFGRRVFLINFPWEILFAAVTFLIMGALLLKKYDISYKKSFKLILASILVSIVISAVFFDRMGINRNIKRQPGLGRIYKSDIDNKNWVMGILQDWMDKYIVVLPPDGHEMRIEITDKTWIPPQRPKVGECIKVVYDESKGNLQAFGITRCQPKHDSQHKRPHLPFQDTKEPIR